VIPIAPAVVLIAVGAGCILLAVIGELTTEKISFPPLRSRTQRIVIGLLGFSLLVPGVLVALGFTIANEPGSRAASADDRRAIPSPSSPDPQLPRQKWVRLSLQSPAPGQPIGDDLTLRITVSQPLAPGHSYWFISQFKGKEGQMYKVWAKVTQSRSLDLSLEEGAVGSTRTYYVVDASGSEADELQENLDAPSWDGNPMTQLDADRVSNSLPVTKERT